MDSWNLVDSKYVIALMTTGVHVYVNYKTVP